MPGILFDELSMGGQVHHHPFSNQQMSIHGKVLNGCSKTDWMTTNRILKKKKIIYSQESFKWKLEIRIRNNKSNPRYSSIRNRLEFQNLIPSKQKQRAKHVYPKQISNSPNCKHKGQHKATVKSIIFSAVSMNGIPSYNRETPQCNCFCKCQ